MVVADFSEDKMFVLESGGHLGASHAEIRRKKISKVRKSWFKDSKVGSIVYVNVTDRWLLGPGMQSLTD